MPAMRKFRTFSDSLSLKSPTCCNNGGCDDNGVDRHEDRQQGRQGCQGAELAVYLSGLHFFASLFYTLPSCQLRCERPPPGGREPYGPGSDCIFARDAGYAATAEAEDRSPDAPGSTALGRDCQLS